jgi:hypothetical protein
MHRSFSEELFTVHQNNFAMYCKPHLQNLPPKYCCRPSETSDGINPARSSSRPDRPHIHIPLGAPKVSPKLLPRAQWMKDTPPFLTDEAADAAYNAACAWTFGIGDPNNFMPQAFSAMTAGPTTAKRQKWSVVPTSRFARLSDDFVHHRFPCASEGSGNWRHQAPCPPPICGVSGITPQYHPPS